MSGCCWQRWWGLWGSGMLGALKAMLRVAALSASKLICVAVHVPAKKR